MPSSNTRFEALAAQHEVDPKIKLSRPDKDGSLTLLRSAYDLLRKELTLIALAILLVGGTIVAAFAVTFGVNFFLALAVFITGGLGIMALVAVQG